MDRPGYWSELFSVKFYSFGKSSCLIRVLLQASHTSHTSILSMYICFGTCIRQMVDVVYSLGIPYLHRLPCVYDRIGAHHLLGGAQQHPMGGYDSWPGYEQQSACSCLAVPGVDPVISPLYNVRRPRDIASSILKTARAIRNYDAPTPYAGPTFTTIAPASYINSK